MADHTTELTLSIVIPTHNRLSVLRQTLAALDRQTYPARQIEVIVVADGCTDDTAAVVRGISTGYRLSVVELSGQGPSIARNQGAVRATGDLLMFLDDDIEAEPDLIAVHVGLHQAEPTPQAIISYLPPRLNVQRGLFRSELRMWWEDTFVRMREIGRRARYSDLLTGNFSIKTEVFRRVGGFNPALRCHEDYEFGLRLIQAGVVLTFAHAARGYHHEITQYDRSLRRKFDEGRADVQIGYLHPVMRQASALRWHFDHTPDSRLERFIHWLAFAWPRGGDWAAAFLRRLGDVFEALHLRGRWRQILYILLGYWYLRGVETELKTRAAVRAYLDEVRLPAPTYADIDLSLGLEAAERLLDTTRPDGAYLRFGPHALEVMEAQPGLEPLRGVHLRPFLALYCGPKLLDRFRADQAVGGDSVAVLRRIIAALPDFLPQQAPVIAAADLQPVEAEAAR